MLNAKGRNTELLLILCGNEGFNTIVKYTDNLPVGLSLFSFTIAFG